MIQDRLKRYYSNSDSRDTILRFISTLSSRYSFCLAEQNCLCNFGRGYHEEHLCEIILNLDQWEMPFKDFLFSSVAAILSS